MPIALGCPIGFAQIKMEGPQPSSVAVKTPIVPLGAQKNGPPEGDPFLFEVFLGDQSSNPGIQGHSLPQSWKKSRRSFTSTSPSPVKSPGQGSR